MPNGHSRRPEAGARRRASPHQPRPDAGRRGTDRTCAFPLLSQTGGDAIGHANLGYSAGRDPASSTWPAVNMNSPGDAARPGTGAARTRSDRSPKAQSAIPRHVTDARGPGYGIDGPSGRSRCEPSINGERQGSATYALAHPARGRSRRCRRPPGLRVAVKHPRRDDDAPTATALTFTLDEKEDPYVLCAIVHALAGIGGSESRAILGAEREQQHERSHPFDA